MALLLCVLPLLYGSLLFPSTSSRIWVYADVGHRDHIPLWGETGAGLCWSSVPPRAAVLQLLYVQPPGTQLQGQEWCCWCLLPSAPPPQPGVLLRFGGIWVEILSLFSRALTVRDRHLQSTEMASLRSVISHLNSFGV